MSDLATGTRTHDDPRPGLVISPLLVLMLGLSAFFAVKHYQFQLVSLVGAGLGFDLAAAALWFLYGAIGVAVIVRLQRYARRPGWTIFVALCWGGFACVHLGALALGFDPILTKIGAEGAYAYTTSPYSEELVKGVGVIALALVPVLHRFRAVDGLFYGAVVGAGFQVLENYEYTIHAALDAPDAKMQALWLHFLLRGVIGVFSHAAWTAVVGAAIGWAFSGGRAGRAARVLTAVVAYLLVGALHCLMNWSAINNLVWLTLLGSLISLVLLVVVVLRVQRSEKQWLTRLAVDNDGWGVLDTSSLSAADLGHSGRKRRRLELRYAYAREQYGPEGRLTRRAEAALADSDRTS